MNNNYHFFSKVCFIFLMFAGVFGFAQTGVKIKYYTGTEQSFNVSPSGKLYFSGDNLLVKTEANSTETSIPVSIIQKITFTDEVLATQNVGLNKSNLQLYPNPSTDYIRIKSEAKSLDVKIYNLEGKLVVSGTYKSDEDINVCKLNAGVYLVQANGVTLKFIKK
ncbi:T9SS type A sorting domain-containing protein [Epilithonimonas sp. JDS]|uniref:T9SS type A sorting domain-containing protein n=1 Tax=Epilithonimonas sp. JDS TaxID=2902797 RepID=UPI001E36679D|nr:T9SS type A sorting domain-containing protein [Epilithonimonas sp. JDS]MCD9856084.1 T9SS type A sorting domain-containing protein [Epilithonimonas sp. JDS]